MNTEVIRALTEKACASIRFRTRKEILGEDVNTKDYLKEILDDKRVKYAFSWQKADGYLGEYFHAGWIPDAKLKRFNTGAETALRFLSEMGVPANYSVVNKGLKALLKDNWNPDPWKLVEVYEPEIGLYGWGYLRSVVFSYFGIEEHDFIKTEIKRALKVINKVTEISSIKNITGTYQNKLYFNKGIALPDTYHLKLLAFTKGWRTGKNINTLAKAIEHLIELSPIPDTYIKYGNQLAAPAKIVPQNLKQSPQNLSPKEWFWWLRTMELFARMGIVKKISGLMQQVNDLKEMLNKDNGFFPIKPHDDLFKKWNVHAGLALEDSWKNNRWK